METILVLIIVLCCASLLIKKIAGQLKGEKCNCGCGNCAASSNCITKLLKNNHKTGEK